MKKAVSIFLILIALAFAACATKPAYQTPERVCGEAVLIINVRPEAKGRGNVE